MEVFLWFLYWCNGDIIIKLNLGCKDDLRIGYENYDREVDLNKKLRWKNNTVDEILCYHVIEHLNDPEFTIDEIDRILKKDGLLKVKLPMNTCSYEHKRYRHGFGYFYKLVQSGRYELIKLKPMKSKWGNPYKDTFQRFKSWLYNLFFNELYWELKKK